MFVLINLIAIFFSALLWSIEGEFNYRPAVNLDGEPSAIINNTVNIITGDYTEVCTDFIIPGPHPIIIQRSYCSSGDENTLLGGGWSLNHGGVLKLEKAKSRSRKYEYEEGAGPRLCFEGDYNISRRAPLHPNANCLEKGVTNCANGEISGRTNLKNVSMQHTNGQYVLSAGNGERLEFHDHTEHKKYLGKIIKPDGSYLLHTYKDRGFASVYLHNRENKPLSGFGIFKNHGETALRTHDGRSLTYVTQKGHEKGFSTFKVVSSFLPEQK
jgi:hypothetical protein